MWLPACGACCLNGCWAATTLHMGMQTPCLTRSNAVPLGAAAVASPLPEPVASAASSVGAPWAGIVRGRLFEAGTSLPPIRAVALTENSAPAARPTNDSWMDVLFCWMQLVGAALLQMLTKYTATCVRGGVSRMVAVVGLVAMASATVGAPALGVRMTKELEQPTCLPEDVMPITRMVSAHGRRLIKVSRPSHGYQRPRQAQSSEPTLGLSSPSTAHEAPSQLTSTRQAATCTLAHMMCRRPGCTTTPPQHPHRWRGLRRKLVWP